MRSIKNTTELNPLTSLLLLFSKKIPTSRFKQNWIILYTKLLFEVSIESPTTGTVYHDGYVWSLYSTGSQALSKRKNRS